MSEKLKGLCPVDKLECNDKCALYRRGFRYKDDDSKPIPFEECAINIACDCLENLISRNISLQKEMNMARNSSDQVAQILSLGLQNSLARQEDLNNKPIIEQIPINTRKRVKNKS